MPKVSVIIPVYNVEKYLRQCMDSVVNQTLSDIEIICVNDCSPDNSLSILQEYADKDKRIKVIDLPQNGGLGHARNVVLDITTGDYIMYLDSDDWLELNACEIAYNHISKNKNDFVFFNYNNYSDDTKEIQYNDKRFESLASQPNLSDINPAEIDKSFFSPVTAWSKIYNREFLLINKMKFYEERKTYEDKFFYTRALNCANSISFINKPLYNYRKREGSITRVLINNIDYLYASDKVFDYLLESHARKNLIKSII